MDFGASEEYIGQATFQFLPQPNPQGGGAPITAQPTAQPTVGGGATITPREGGRPGPDHLPPGRGRPASGPTYILYIYIYTIHDWCCLCVWGIALDGGLYGSVGPFGSLFACNKS